MSFDWAAGLTDDQWAAALAGGDNRVPPLPPAAKQAMFVGSSGIQAFKEPSIFWANAKRALAADGRPLSKRSKLLDVGVGWGRLYRWALRDFPIKNIEGIDVDSGAIEMCKAAMPSGNFTAVSPDGDYPFRQGSFDLAFLYSVFSHLSEDTARSTLGKISKVLKPGGHVALTTLRLAHIDVWDRQQSDQYYAPALKRVNFDRNSWWEDAAEGRHMYVPIGGGDDSRPEDSYGEAVVPKLWWASLAEFDLVEFSRGTGLPQVFVVLRKR